MLEAGNRACPRPGICRQRICGLSAPPKFSPGMSIGMPGGQGLTAWAAVRPAIRSVSTARRLR
jgi:hypothetical protein